MRLAFILVRSEEAGEALKRKLDALGYRPELLVLPSPPSEVGGCDGTARETAGLGQQPQAIRPSAQRAGGVAECTNSRTAWVADQLQEIAVWMERCADRAGGLQLLHGAIGVAELHDLDADGWDFLEDLLNTKQASTASLILLVLQSFPEVHWILWSYWRQQKICSLHPHWNRLFQIGSLLEIGEAASWNRMGFDPLFDPLGVQAWIRSRIAANPKRPAPYLPVRTTTAVALDEEPEYSYLNAYVTWRFGVRSWVVQNWSLAQQLLGPESSELHIALALEDLYLNFADRPAECHLSQPDIRMIALPLLEKAVHRVLITVGPRHRGSRWRFAPHILKPVSGVFELWAQLRRLTGIGRLVLQSGFRWPPKESRQDQEWPGHSSPGPLFDGARYLIARARRLLKEADSVEEAIRAAALAVHAKELLGCRTPTTALVALSLQHEAEVVAESLFLGVEHNIRLHERFRDIEREVNAVSRWFKVGRRKRAGLNARLTIIERLAQRFQDLHQVEEELACLAEARKLRFDFWVREEWWRWPAWPFLRYLALTLRSLPTFLTVVVCWAVFFGLSYYALGTIAREPDPGFWDALIGSTRTFFTGDSTSSWSYLANKDGTGGWDAFWNIWLTFQGIISSTNLGLLLSHLYLVVSRR